MKNLMEELQVYGELLSGVDYDVVARHPLADETELLAQLGLSPEQIVLCDLYWAYSNRLFFVTVGYHSFASKPLVSYRRRLDIEHGHQFWINTNVSPLTKTIINKCLHYLAAWIENNDTILEETDKNAILYQSLPDNDISSPSKSATIVISYNDVAASN